MLKIKKIDKLIAKKFFPSFITAFSIALFVLIMQVLWLYIDEIVGKGASLFMILEMVFYLSVKMVPEALPLGVLVASVMVLGGMGENYELSSMKSAGMSLWRIMRPIMVVSGLIGLFSFVTANTFIPMAEMKFQSRMYDIRQQQPVFQLEPGVFNQKFDNMTIHIQSKGRDNESIYGVKIYNNENSPKAKLSLITAEKGRMYTLNNGNHMVLQLENGVQYDEDGLDKKDKYPFKITNFKSYQKIFDMSQFGIEPLDEKVWKSHYNALNIQNLAKQVDTITQKLNISDENYLKDLQRGVGFREITNKKETKDAKNNQKIKNKKNKPLKNKNSHLLQIDSLVNMDIPFLNKFPPKRRKGVKSKAVSMAKNALAIKKRADENRRVHMKKRDKYIYAMHKKISGALICIIFLFIGAPLGAIVRKGGFGFPILISILFFMFYYIVNIFFKKTMKTAVLSAPMAIWIPVLIMAVIGLVITIAAMKNVKMKLPNLSSLFNKTKEG